MVKSRPHVILSAAISLDGKLASIKGDSKFSSKKDLVRVHKLRSKIDAILVGSNTVKRDDPSLTVRLVKGKNPIRIILDSRGSISLNSKIVKTSKTIPTIFAVSQKASKRRISELQKRSIEVIIVGENHVNIPTLLSKLAKKKIKTLLVEGGGTVNWEFLSKNLVDEIIVTLSPFLIGGKKAISLMEGSGFSKIKQSPKLKLRKVTKVGNEIVLKYSVD